MFVKVRAEFVSAHNENTLKLSLEPGTDPSANPLEALPPSTWNGVLRATKLPEGELTGELGDWTLTEWQELVEGGTYDRIDPNAIEDNLVVCHYSI